MYQTSEGIFKGLVTKNIKSRDFKKLSNYISLMLSEPSISLLIRNMIRIAFLYLMVLIPNNSNSQEFLTVAKVIDGCKFVAKDYPFNGRLFMLKGIDCPKSKYDNKKAQPLYTESKAYLKDLIDDKEIMIEYASKDKIDRAFPVYVYTEEKIFVNKEMIDVGYARVADEIADCDKCAELIDAQKIAQRKKILRWGNDYDYNAPQEIDPDIEEPIFKIVEQMPSFPGCSDIDETDKERWKCARDLMLDFLYSNLDYPPKAIVEKSEGMAVVRFIVEKDGSLSNIEVLRDPGSGCGKEAARLVELMNNMDEKWTPGYQNGHPVKVLYTLPIKFKLDKE